MKLKPEQYDAIRLLAQPKKVRKTYAQIAEEVGVSERTIYRWLQNDEFIIELRREIVRQSAQRLPDVVDSMTEAAIKDRNAAAAKLIMQAHDMLSDKVLVKSEKKESAPSLEELKNMLKAYEADDEK